MITINNIYDLLHILFDVLGSDFTVEVISGAFLNDTIKVTKQGSTNAMYLGFDNECPTVIDATVWDEPEGYHGRYDDWPVSEGIYWDTEDEKLTPETIYRNMGVPSGNTESLKKKRGRIRATALQILNYWRDCGEIHGYEETTKGRAAYSVQIQPVYI